MGQKAVNPARPPAGFQKRALRLPVRGLVIAGVFVLALAVFGGLVLWVALQSAGESHKTGASTTASTAGAFDGSERGYLLVILTDGTSPVSCQVFCGAPAAGTLRLWALGAAGTVAECRAAAEQAVGVSLDAYLVLSYADFQRFLNGLGSVTMDGLTYTPMQAAAILQSGDKDTAAAVLKAVTDGYLTAGRKNKFSGDFAALTNLSGGILRISQFAAAQAALEHLADSGAKVQIVQSAEALAA